MKLNIGQKKLGLALDRRSSLVSVRSSTREGTTTLPQKGKLKLKKKKSRGGAPLQCALIDSTNQIKDNKLTNGLRRVNAD